MALQHEMVFAPPAALEGVKSRTKAIFKADKVQLNNLRIMGVSVSLDSRIAIVGEGSQTMLPLLQGNLTAESGKVARHESIVLAHLGPQLAGAAAESTAHLAAIAEALKDRPQVLILEEALAHGGAGWARTFRQLIRCPALSTFQGAVIVACDKEVTYAVKHICSELWTCANGQVNQNDMPGRQFSIIEDALTSKASSEEPSKASDKKQKGGKQGRKQEADAGAQANLLIEEARVLSEYWFEEDLLKTARKGDWTVAFLTEKDTDASGLRGFISYKWVDAPAGRELLIERVAVAKAHRKRGFGKLLMRWIIGEVSRMPLADCSMVTCSALANVVSFYASLGFVANPDREACEADEDDEPSTFMELPNASLVTPITD